jgi:signal peptidase
MRLLVALSFALLAVLGLGPRTGAYQTMTVLTASMAPAIPAGSVIVIRPVDPARLRAGDVVTYRIPVQDHRIVTHRIVEIAGDPSAPTVRTKGDALEEADPWTTRFRAGTPVWRVHASVPRAGYAVRALRGTRARQLTLGVVPGLLALLLLGDIWAPRGRRRA